MTEPRTLSEFVLSDRWRFIAVIGAGADGTVYLGVDEKNGERVAIKVYDSLVGHDAASIQERISNEVALRADFASPHLVNIVSHGVARGQGGQAAGYMVMEHLEGRTLRSHLESSGGRLRFNEALILARQTARALAALHEGRVIHLDLKPENVFLLSVESAARCGVPIKLLDLGAARRVDRPFNSVQVRGTPMYVAPEVCERLPSIGHQADVYAMGIMLYELLVGAPPLQSGTPAQLVAQHVYAQLATLPAGQDWGPIADVYARATARQADQRFANASELLAALEAVPDYVGGRTATNATTARGDERPSGLRLDALLPRTPSTPHSSAALLPRATPDPNDPPSSLPPSDPFGPLRRRDGSSN